MRLREGPVTVLHLRSASGGGGGADSVIHDLAVGLHGAEFRVLAGYLHRRDEDASPLCGRLARSGIETVDLPGRRFFDRRQFGEVVRIVGERQVEILHCHDYKADFYGVLLRRRFAALKLVSTAHGWNHTSWKGALYDGLDKFFLRAFDVVIAVSAEIEAIARSRGIARVRKMANAVDTACWRREPRLRQLLPASEKVVGFVGRLSPEKGPLDFVRLAARVVADEPGCRFVMAGEGPERQRVLELIDHLGLGTRLELPGLLDRDRLRSLYRQLDVLVLPSYSEGIPLSVLEALAMEVPVVATRVGGVGEVVCAGVTGLLSAAGDVERLARQVTGLLRNPTLAATLSGNGRALVEREFSLVKNVRVLAEIYREVTGMASPPPRP